MNIPSETYGKRTFSVGDLKMSFRRALILVEGQTEEKFIKEIFSPFLMAKYALWLDPKIVTTKTYPDSPDAKGGDIRYEKVKPQLFKLLNDSHAAFVTTMFDYYKIGTDFPGYDSNIHNDCYKRVKHIEHKISEDINNRNFIPYLQLHEFETFLFVNPDITASKFLGVDKNCIIMQLNSIKSSFNNPEEINDDTETAPSKRIKAVYDKYDKVLDGYSIVSALGIEKIANECNHFNEWIEKIK